MGSVRVRVPEHVLIRSVNGELVLLNLDNEHVYGLDEVATVMWEAVTDTPTVEDAVEQLSSQFEIDRETLSSDLGKLLDELSGCGLVELDPS
jgi:hypothetical protein